VLWPIPIALLAVGGIAYAVAQLIGRAAHTHELLAAAIVSFAAGELALMPLIWTRGGRQVSISQAGLAATMIHLVLMIVLAGLSVLMGIVGAPVAFLFWLLAFYWVSLAILVAIVLAAIRSTPVVGKSIGGQVPAAPPPDRP
jgi:hypothetical protein